jgi:hypothetical protein
MKTIFRPITIPLIPLLLFHFLILNPAAAYGGEKRVTPIPPESVGEISVKPVEEEPVKEVKKKGISGWWLLLGAIVIGAAAAVNQERQKEVAPTIK